jgi:hypothetical protein
MLELNKLATQYLDFKAVTFHLDCEKQCTQYLDLQQVGQVRLMWLHAAA